jgi:hypothetical protein
MTATEFEASVNRAIRRDVAIGEAQAMAESTIDEAKSTARRLRAATAEVVKLIEGRVDVLDSDYGPRPNAAMLATQMLEGDYGKVDAATIDSVYDLLDDAIATNRKLAEALAAIDRVLGRRS